MVCLAADRVLSRRPGGAAGSLRTHHRRGSLLIEAAIIVRAATGHLGIAAVPALGDGDGDAERGGTHGIVASMSASSPARSNAWAKRLVAETVPGQPAQRETQAPIVLTILVFYAAARRCGALAARWDAAALILPAAVSRQSLPAAAALDRVGGAAR